MRIDARPHLTRLGFGSASPTSAVMLLAGALSAGAVFGQGRTLWQDRGVRLCGNSSDEAPIAATSDAAGGAIVLWPDGRRGGYYYDIYAQRVDAAGVPQWTPYGVLLRDSIGAIGDLRVVDDGENGAIAVWWDMGGTPWLNQLTAQRVSADGVPLWGRHGMTVRGRADDVAYWCALVPDGGGGVIIISGIHPVNGGQDSLIMSRMDSSGGLVWETCIRTDSLDEPLPFACGDGRGGAVVAWQESEGSRFGVRVQHIDSAGAIQWDSSGTPVCTLNTTQRTRACMVVGESCFVVGWIDYDAGTWQIRAQMLDWAGSRLWGSAGVPVSGVLSAGSAGTGLTAGGGRQSLWVWMEERTGTDDFFAQKLDSIGARCWDSSGIWLGTSDTSQCRGLSATGDSRGGAIVAWPLYRNPRNWDLYAQHVDSAGRICWSDTGLAVCRDTNLQFWVPSAVTDGAGGAILAWQDLRWAYGPGTYAQRVADGAGVMESTNAEVRATNSGPTVVRGVLVLNWLGTRSELPERNSVMSRAALLDISGRKVLALHSGANDVRALAPGVYFVRAVGLESSVVSCTKIVLTK